MAGNAYKKLKFKIMLSSSKIIETNKWLIKEVLTFLWSSCPVYGNVPWFSPQVSLSGDRDYSVCLWWNETKHSTECKQQPDQAISCKYTHFICITQLWIQYNIIHFVCVSAGRELCYELASCMHSLISPNWEDAGLWIRNEIPCQIFWGWNWPESAPVPSDLCHSFQSVVFSIVVLWSYRGTYRLLLEGQFCRMFPQNINVCLYDYTVSQPKRWQSEQSSQRKPKNYISEPYLYQTKILLM
jgi:hypothetical protein